MTTANKKENLELLDSLDLVELYENREDLYFETEEQRNEFLTALYAEIITRYIDNTKYTNGLSDIKPLDLILRDQGE